MVTHHAADIVKHHQRMAAGVPHALRDGGRRAQRRIALTQRRACAGAGVACRHINVGMSSWALPRGGRATAAARWRAFIAAQQPSILQTSDYCCQASRLYEVEISTTG